MEWFSRNDLENYNFLTLYLKKIAPIAMVDFVFLIKDPLRLLIFIQTITGNLHE